MKRCSLPPVRALGVLLLPLVLVACATRLPPRDDFSPAEAAAQAREQGRLNSALTGEAKRRYVAVREQICTREIFHSAVVAPAEYLSRYPLYIVGIEKPRRASERPYCMPADAERCGGVSIDITRFSADPRDPTVADMRQRLFGDPRSTAITHALRVGRLGATGGAASACFVYNVYASGDGPGWCLRRFVGTTDAAHWTREGWRMLPVLRDELRAAAEAEGATHIVLLSTGWNTDQYESLLDYEAWMRRWSEAMPAGFRPLFVGVSWESSWSSGFWSHLPFASWSTKGNDADEIGFGWANALLNSVLEPVARERGAALVAIGHSFGSRVVLGAHFARDVLGGTNVDGPRAAPLLIGLQAAFPIGRFGVDDGIERTYIASRRGSATVVITSSMYDKATRSAPGTAYIGGPVALDRVRAEPARYAEAIVLAETDSNGRPAAAPLVDRTTLYDASPFVNRQLRGTDSGAHSDVYTSMMGRFLAEIANAATRGR